VDRSQRPRPPRSPRSPRKSPRGTLLGPQLTARPVTPRMTSNPAKAAPYHHNNHAHRPPKKTQHRGIRPLARNLHGTSSSYARSTPRGGSGRVFTPMHSTAPAPALTAARRPRNRAMFATSSLSRRVPTVNILGFDLRKFACPTLALVRKKQLSCGDDAGYEPLFFHSPCFSPPFPPSL
jgi:hypothetical protein